MKMNGTMWSGFVLLVALVASVSAACSDTCGKPVPWDSYPEHFCTLEGKTYQNSHCISSVFMSAHCFVEHDKNGVQYPGPCSCPNGCLSNTVNGLCGGWGCDCRAGYRGQDCSQIICSEGNVCYRGDSCGRVLGRDICLCTDGFQGMDCSIAPVTLGDYPRVFESHQYSDADKYGDDHPIYNASAIAQIHINMSEADLDFLLDGKNQDSSVYMHAGFWFYNGVESEWREDIGFRIKGGYSRKGAKKTFKVSFNAFEKGADWKQVKKINMKGVATDPSIIREIFSTDVAMSLDTYIPRYGYAQLYINDMYYGVYLMVENLDDKFVKSRFGSKNAGMLWKCLGGLEYIDSDPDSYRSVACYDRVCYDPKTDLAEEDFGPLAHFIDVLNNTPDPEFADAIKQVLDVERFMRAMAFEVMTGNWDGLRNGNNYYLFWNLELERMQYIRYDQDVAFGTLLRSHPVADVNVFEWGEGEPGVLISRMLAVKEFRVMMAEAILYLIKSGFTGADDSPWTARYRAYQQQLATPLLQDRWWNLDGGFLMSEFEFSWNTTLVRPSYPPIPFEAIWMGVGEFVEVRSMTALEQIKSELRERV